MPLIRPEVADRLIRWREALIAVAVGLFGLWVMTRGGWFLGAVGIAVLVLAGALFWSAVQRLRLAPADAGPGLVEIDEGQIAWYGPGVGGFVSVRELSELGLVTVQGLRVWRLRQTDGQLLLIPTGAQGVERLFDALTSLPDLEIQRLVAALEAGVDAPFLWRRPRPSEPRLART